MFVRYQHVERIDADETEGLLDGVCHIFPKMDGSNMCAYTEDGEVRTMSRNKRSNLPSPSRRSSRGALGSGGSSGTSLDSACTGSGWCPIR